MSGPGMNTQPGVSKLLTMSITGNPTADTVIRYGMVGLCGWATGAITGFLNARGFTDPNLFYYVGMALATIIGGVATAAWGIIRTSKNEYIIRLREAIAVQAGINVAVEPTIETPAVVTVKQAQTIIAEHATPVEK